MSDSTQLDGYKSIFEHKLSKHYTIMSTPLLEWASTHNDSLSTKIQRTPDDKNDTVEATLLRLPAKDQTHLAGLSKINPPVVGFIWFERKKKDVLVAINPARAAKMFKKVKLNLKVNVETIKHSELGSIEIPLIPVSVFNTREEARKVREDSISYWNAIGTTRHSAPMNSHSQHPLRKDLKKLKNRSLHKAWSEFKQSQYCTSIQLQESAYQIFTQACTREERKKWDQQALEKKRLREENGEPEPEEDKKVAVEQKPPRKKRRR